MNINLRISSAIPLFASTETAQMTLAAWASARPISFWYYFVHSSAFLNLRNFVADCLRTPSGSQTQVSGSWAAVCRAVYSLPVDGWEWTCIVSRESLSRCLFSWCRTSTNPPASHIVQGWALPGLWCISCSGEYVSWIFHPLILFFVYAQPCSHPLMPLLWCQLFCIICTGYLLVA